MLSTAQPAAPALLSLPRPRRLRPLPLEQLPAGRHHAAARRLAPVYAVAGGERRPRQLPPRVLLRPGRHYCGQPAPLLSGAVRRRGKSRLLPDAITGSILSGDTRPLEESRTAGRTGSRRRSWSRRTRRHYYVGRSEISGRDGSPTAGRVGSRRRSFSAFRYCLSGCG